MADQETPTDRNGPPGDRHGTRLIGWTLALLAAVVVFAVLFSERSQATAYLPWLLIAACPLLHLFMHRHHDHGPRGSRDRFDHDMHSVNDRVDSD